MYYRKLYLFFFLNIIKKEKNENNNQEEAIFIVMQWLFIRDVTKIAKFSQFCSDTKILSFCPHILPSEA